MIAKHTNTNGVSGWEWADNRSMWKIIPVTIFTECPPSKLAKLTRTVANMKTDNTNAIFAVITVTKNLLLNFFVIFSPYPGSPTTIKTKGVVSACKDNTNKGINTKEPGTQPTGLITKSMDHAHRTQSTRLGFTETGFRKTYQKYQQQAQPLLLKSNIHHWIQSH